MHGSWNGPASSETRMTVTFPSPRRLLAAASLFALSVVPARAQFSLPPAPPAGEDYHVEVAAAWWQPTPSVTIASESLGIAGTDVSLTDDLGVESARLLELRGTLRPGRKHKFRVARLPLRYQAEAAVTKELVFNGLRYRVGLPVKTDASFTAYRFGYEYDFVATDKGYFGVVLDAKYTDVNVSLSSALGEEYTKAVAPIPTFGAVARTYVTRTSSITAEINYLKVPENLSENYQGRYLDYDVYSTVNIGRHSGVQVGYRSVNVSYRAKLDSGAIVLKGFYLAGVVRF